MYDKLVYINVVQQQRKVLKKEYICICMCTFTHNMSTLHLPICREMSSVVQKTS